MSLNLTSKHSDIIKTDRSITNHLSKDKRKDDDHSLVSCYGYIAFFIAIKLRMQKE